MLDKLETDQYKIIVDDACKWLKTYKEEKKQFDIIFGDLTDIPVHEGGSTWEFVRTVIKSALSLLPVGELTNGLGYHELSMGDVEQELSTIENRTILSRVE